MKQEFQYNFIFNATETRNQSYHKLFEKNYLSENQNKVYAVISNNPNISNSEIAQILNKTINTITPRVFELRKFGLVVPHSKKICKVSGKLVQGWCIIE